MVTTREVAWAGEDDPDRLDTASVRLTRTSLTAHGTQRTAAWAACWRLTCGPDWVTQRMVVQVLARDWSRSLDLSHDGRGGWRDVAEVDGDPDLPPPGIGTGTDLTGALDCDLGLCPLTNTMPILRLGLLSRPAAPQLLTMAWIDMPSLQVLAVPQRYSAPAPGRVVYESERRDFSAELSVDADGIVADCPALARRVTWS